MAFIRCGMSGGGVKTLTITVSGSANKNGLEFAVPATPNNVFSGTGTVTISVNEEIIGEIPITISTQAKMSDNHASTYIHTSASGSGTVVLK